MAGMHTDAAAGAGLLDQVNAGLQDIGGVFCQAMLVERRGDRAGVDVIVPHLQVLRCHGR